MFLEKYFWEIIKESITIEYEKLNKKNFGESRIMNPFNIKITSVICFSDPLKYP